MDCLALRQKLKQRYRDNLRKENGNVTSNDKVISSDNYGRFFGHSEVVLAGKIVRENKLWSDALQRLDKSIKRDGYDREKLDWLKESRDYSFLGSDCDIQEKKPVVNRDSIPKKDCLGKTKNSFGLKNCIPRTLENKVKRTRVSYVKPKKHMINKSCKEDPIIKKKINAIEEHKGIKRKELDQEMGACARSMIRDMFGYYPNDYSSDDESDMEVSFADIQKEERRSAKIAKKEDDEELKKIVQEQSRRPKKRIN